jgi:hypothetical protein
LFVKPNTNAHSASHVAVTEDEEGTTGEEDEEEAEKEAEGGDVGGEATKLLSCTA